MFTMLINSVNMYIGQPTRRTTMRKEKEVNVSYHCENFEFKKIEVSYEFTPQRDWGPNDPKDPYTLKITSIVAWAGHMCVDIRDCITKSAFEKIENDILEDELGVKP